MLARSMVGTVATGAALPPSEVSWTWWERDEAKLPRWKCWQEQQRRQICQKSRRACCEARCSSIETLKFRFYKNVHIKHHQLTHVYLGASASSSYIHYCFPQMTRCVSSFELMQKCWLTVCRNGTRQINGWLCQRSWERHLNISGRREGVIHHQGVWKWRSLNSDH
jgi:hypothetical protein